MTAVVSTLATSPTRPRSTGSPSTTVPRTPTRDGSRTDAGSGIVIGVDTLCYRSWQDLARLTAHEVARYMGLYDNVEIDPTHTDPIHDNDAQDPSTNLMFYSELGGYSLSPGQRDILTRSPVLR